MAKKTMTMHQLLAELKRYDDRINKAMHKSVIGVCIPGSTKTDVIDEKKTEYTANMASIEHLISNLNVLEATRIQSNATTMVTVGSQTYTVAEAIKRKHLIAYEKNFLSVLRMAFASATKQVEDNNIRVENDADKIFHDMVTGESVNPAADSIRGNYIESHKSVLVDPCELAKKIDALEKSIEEFETNVDAALSVSNATTSVVVDLED